MPSVITVFAGGSLFVNAGQRVELTDARASSTNPDDVLIAQVDWLDGGGYQGAAFLQHSGEIVASHVYQFGDVYNVVIRISNEYGDTGETTQNIVVEGAPGPTPTPAPPPTPTAGPTPTPAPTATAIPGATSTPTPTIGPTPVPTSVPTPVPTATPSTTIGDGIWAVGSQVAPGTYSNAGGSFCYWARLSGFSGELGDTIANGISDSPQIVTIGSGDAGFESSGCGTWTRGVPTLPPSTTIGDGIWAVGSQVAPGTYSNAGGSFCYWARLSGFSGELGDTIANGISDSPQTITINSGDAGFESSGCGTWTRTPAP